MGSKRGIPPRESISKASLILTGIPVEYVDGVLEDYVQAEDKKEFIGRYIQHIHTMYEDKIHLALYGANGTGKSFLSTILIKEAYRCRYKACMLTLAELMDLTFKERKSEEDLFKLKLVNESEFLVIDELGKENFTKSGSNIVLLESVLRNAVRIGQVVIMCTNLPLVGKGGLYEQYGKSISSLVEGSFVKLEFVDSDYRKEVMHKKKALKILMGEE